MALVANVKLRHYRNLIKLQLNGVFQQAAKGIVTREDAELAVEHGVDGIRVSNHGRHDGR